MGTFEVRGEFITLGKLLKAAGAAGSGGEVKEVLAGTGITVNGEPESRRGRKLRPGDVVAIDGFGEIQLTAES